MSHVHDPSDAAPGTRPETLGNHDHLETILDFVRWAASRMDEHGVFLGHGTHSYLDEAAWLVLEGLRLPPDLGHDWWRARLTSEERSTLVELIRRRCLDHTPTAYLLNRAWFLGQPYYVDERVLIPRSPFGDLIRDDFKGLLARSPTPQRLLDIGTGSGCIAIALAEHFPQADVVGSDIDFGALAVASHNIADYQLADRVELIQSDGFDQLLDADDKPLVFDLIVSNPPYVDPDEAEDLPDEYHHEPAGALFAPDQGLALVERLLDQAADHLSPGGWIFIEMGNGRHWFDQRWPGHHGLWVELSPAPSSIVAFKHEQLGQWRGEETT
ncbi:50S ribosomal protein L3 N(5)-glutamine methyltransferase [Guyparkeria sp. TX1]|uniref:50S ribosomal protein L3 N(5)-glutamine methyltransferase n=1 Tax=Guyparkeria sp. TX1 TaxID=3115001 RepID=UPI003977BD0E